MVKQDPRLKQSRAALTLAALGIVYGDIGTSPLYAAKETFNPGHGIPLNAANVFGGLSTIFWSLMIVVSLKYVILIMRADNKGEGGIMALLALASSAVKDRPRLRAPIMLLGVFGASLFYGDAVLTPAISVLSAVEGLEVGTAAFKPYIVPIAVGVVIGLFALQRQGYLGCRGAVRPGRGALVPGDRGARHLWHRNNPEVLWALNPLHAFRLPHAARLVLVRRARRGTARLHRRRSALRRHGPLRQGPDPHRVVRAGISRAGAELLRAGRAADRGSEGASRIPSIYSLRSGRFTRWWGSRRPRP